MNSKDADVQNDSDNDRDRWPKEVSNTLTPRSRSLFPRDSEYKGQYNLPRKSVSHSQLKANESSGTVGGSSSKSNQNASKNPLQLGKYTYSAKFVRKRLSGDSTVSRLRLGEEMELKRYYDIHRNKYDEMLLLSRATNAIIVVFTTAYASLKASNDCFSTPVSMCLDSPVTKPDAWTGLIAEALKFVSIESSIIQSSHYLHKKRLLNQAKDILTSTIKEALQALQNMGKLAEKLNLVLQDCDRSITSMMTGCRSRFYQSVWQTDVLFNQQGQGDHTFLNEENLLNSVSNSMSTSSLLSLHLLIPYVRWDVDGISIKKQVSKSWPLIKFSYLSFPHKLDFLKELFAGFLAFLQIPTQNIENSLDVLQETSSESRKDVGLLDHQFRTILNVLLSERYFHPAEQHKALVFGFKIQQNFLRLQNELETVQRRCHQLNESWKRIFKNGDITLANASSVLTSTNVPLWKSCKDFCFQLDLNTENDSKSFPVLKTNRSESSPPLPELKQPKIIVQNFPQALLEHFEVIENFEESYKTRLQELKDRGELLIVENDIKPCTDLAQQLFFHFEHIGSTLNDYSRQLISLHESLLTPIPTDPPIAPGTYSNFTPLRLIKGEQSGDSIFVVSVTGWLAAILELLGSLSLTSPLSNFPFAIRLKEKCLLLAKLVSDLATLMEECIKNHEKAEKYMERILNCVEKYFNVLDDKLKILSRVSSAEELPVVPDANAQSEDALATELTNNQDDEVSVFITVNGVFFNQFGVMFSLRLDVTTAEHRLRIIDLFVSQIFGEVEKATNLVKDILKKFGRKTVSNPWWKGFLLNSSQPAMLIQGGLQEEVYGKNIFHLLHNVESAFRKTHVKASLEIYSELEATILIRSTRILEDEIVKFGKACQVFSQGLASLEPFRKYFKKSCIDLFRNPSKFTSPFEKWNNKLCCFKLVIMDMSFKSLLDEVLTSTASENASRTSSDHEIQGKSSPSNIGGIQGFVTTVTEIELLWNSMDTTALEELAEGNALLPEIDPTISRAISLSSGFTDRKYICQTEATSIIIANGVTQVHLETFPKRYKMILSKKIKSLCAKLKECSSIIDHSENICFDKAEKIISRVNDILAKFSHLEFEELKPEEKLNTSSSNVHPINPEPREAQVHENIFPNSSDMDVFVTLDFPFESIKLSYRGYERLAIFRAWNKQPASQAKVLDSMLESISDRLTKIVEVARKLSGSYVQLNRISKKLSQKVDQALTYHPTTLAEPLFILKNLLENLKAQKALIALRDTNIVLQVVQNHLNLAVAFLKKHEELSQEPNFSQNDVTVTVRNPFEKDIRQLFSKPIRIILRYSQFELKL